MLEHIHKLIMLCFILLHTLCMVQGKAFPQRNEHDFESNFNFDSYLEHFTESPLESNVYDPARSSTNQDYRYTPLLGERPDYVPPIFRGRHFQNPNAPKRWGERRVWHPTFQDHNFPQARVEHMTKNVPQTPMQGHNREFHQPRTEFSLSKRQSHFHLHPRIQDFGSHETPVVVEALVSKGRSSIHEQGDLDTPVVVEALTKKGKPAVTEDHHKKPAIVEPPKDKPIIEGHGSNKYMEKPSIHKDYDTPEVVEAIIKKGKPVIMKGHKEPIVVESTEIYSSDYVDYDTPIVVEALIKKTPSPSKMKGHKKPTVEHPTEVKSVMKVPGHKNPILKPTEGKPVVSEGYGYENPEEKPYIHGENKPVIVNGQVRDTPPDYDYEQPIVVEALTKEGDTVTKKHGHKKPVIVQTPIKVHSAVTKHATKKGQPVFKDYEHKPIMGEVDLNSDYDLPVVVEAIVKRDPVIQKDETKLPGGLQPTKHHDYETPIVVEALVKKGNTVTKKHGHKEPGLVDSPGIGKPSNYDDYDTPVVVEALVKKGSTVTKKHGHKEPGLVDSPGIGKPSNYDDYDTPVVVEAVIKKGDPVMDIHYKKSVSIDPPSQMKQMGFEDDYDIPVVVEAKIKKETPGLTKEHGPKIVELPLEVKPEVYHKEDYETPSVVSTTKKTVANNHGHKRPLGETRTKRKPIGMKKHNKPIVMKSQVEDGYDTNEKRVMYDFDNPILVDPRVKDKEPELGDRGSELVSKIPGALDKRYSAKENPVQGILNPRDFSDTPIIVDSITVNRENPGSPEIPILDILAVEDKVNGEQIHANAGRKIVAFNKENGAINVLDIGNEHRSHEIEDFDDFGSGVISDERSVVPRSILPLNSNAWSFMTHIQAQERQNFKRCFTPKNETGNCLPIQMCPVPSVGISVDELLKNVCIIDEVFIGICCPEFPVETVHVDWGQFGKPNNEALIDVQTSQETKECGKLPSKIGDQDAWPWTAPLVSSSSAKVFCGGALINEQYVLTAAHCTSRIPRNQILVRLGSLNSQTSSEEFEVVEIKRHAQYNPRTMQDDIALLKLSKRAPLGEFRRLVCLPDEEDYVGETATLLPCQGISGCSEAESLPVISNQECQNGLGTLIGDSVLCTDSRNDETMCNADSGAPLVLNEKGIFKIIGLLTWNRNDCDNRFPSVFTRISSYRKWIKNHST